MAPRCPRTLKLLEAQLAILRLPPDAALPDWLGGEFRSVTRTPDELSIVCAEACVPVDVAAERGWAAMRVAGQLAFDELGVIADLAKPLQKAGVSIFVVSTHDTDYLLVKATQLATATGALVAAGHHVETA